MRSAESPAEEKLTVLTKIMIDEVFGYSGQGIDIESVIRDGRCLSKEISKLAHFVAHSALHSAATPADELAATEEDFFERINPLINNLSFRIVNEVRKKFNISSIFYLDWLKFIIFSQGTKRRKEIEIFEIT